MNKTFLLFVLSLCFFSCGERATTESAAKQESTSIPQLVNVHITGEVALADSSRIVINTDENTMQPLLTAYVTNNTFTVEGQLEEPNFYNLVVGKQKFKVYLENGKQYQFTGEVSQGKVISGRIVSDSEVMQDYDQMTKALESKKNQLNQQEGAVRAALNNPTTYQAAVEKTAAITAERESYPEQLKMQYINDPQVVAALKLFLIKDEKISRANYKTYNQVLTSVPDSLKGISLYRRVEAKVAQVRDFYENMPNFPDMHPRNVAGDSLNLAQFKDQGTILFVFWGSWNRESKADIALIKSNRAALEKLRITPVYLTWDKDFAAWEKASAALGLGTYNYRLNATDQAFVVTNYAVQKLPHYMLVNAQDLSIINYYFTFPLDGKLINKLKKELH